VDANCPTPQQEQQQSKGGGIASAVLGAMARGVAFAIATSTAMWQIVMKDGTVAAMGREAVKDVRSTLFQVAFGHGEHHGEAGAPLNPTQGEIASDRKGSVYGVGSFPIHRSPSDIIDGKGGVHGQDAGRNGNVMTQEKPTETHDKPQETPPEKEKEWGEREDKKTWVQAVRGPDKATEGNTENDQNKRAEQRSLADEQRERQQEQDHGHSL
jgi:hypothetical protein